MSASRPPTEGPTWRAVRRGVDAPLLVPGLPSEVPFGFLGRVLPTSAAAEVRLDLREIPRAEALELLDASLSVAQAELASGGGAPGGRPSELEVEAAGAEELGHRVAARDQQLWRVGISFHVRARRLASAMRWRDELAHRLQRLGFRTRLPTFDAGPLCDRPLAPERDAPPPGYAHTLPSDGVGAFFPFVDELVAEEGGLLAGLLLDDASPVFLNRWTQTSHSWGIFGATGSGKTFAAALTLLRTRWMDPTVSIYVLDPLGEFGALGRALGGTTISLGRPDGPSLHPLDPATTGDDRTEKAGRVAAMLRALFPSLSDEEAAALDSAVSRLYERRSTPPTFRELRRELGEEPSSAVGRLFTLLEVFTTGPLGYLDRAGGIDPATTPLVVDLSGVAESHRAFHASYVLDWIYGRLRERSGPKLLVLDEAHLVARHPATAEFFDRLVRHVRHFSAGVLVVSQNPDDFLATDAGRSLLRNLRATLFLRLPEVSPDCQRFFGLTDAEVEWLPKARLPKEAGYAEGLLRLGPSHLPLALVASTPEYDFLTRGLSRGPAPPPAPPGAAPTARL